MRVGRIAERGEAELPARRARAAGETSRGNGLRTLYAGRHAANAGWVDDDVGPFVLRGVNVLGCGGRDGRSVAWHPGPRPVGWLHSRGSQISCVRGTERQQRSLPQRADHSPPRKGNFATITTIRNDHYIRSSAAFPTSPPYEDPCPEQRHTRARNPETITVSTGQETANSVINSGLSQHASPTSTTLPKSSPNQPALCALA